ncbi:endospore germination permease [Bacillaceae bacterium IKA-2]|nr:endospore germination permease [Bacillaceae bacterium IKA-2]
MNYIKISTAQALMILISSITVTGHLLFIPVILNHSGRDGWISVLLSFFSIIYIIYIITKLSLRYQGQTIIEYAEIILGKYFGKILSLVLIFYFFHDGTLSIRGFGEFYTTEITPDAPILIYLTLIVILAVYTVRQGLEVLVRTNQFFLVVMVIIGITASMVTFPEKDYRNLLPILEFGIQPVLMGALSLTSLFSTFVVAGMIFPYIYDPKSLKRFSLVTGIMLILLFLGPITGPIAVYGGERAVGFAFPTFQLLRDISIGDIQRLDLFGILLWSMGSFSKISLHLFATSLGIAKLFKLNDYKPLIIPVGALMIIVGLQNSENFIEVYRFLKDVYPYYSTLIGILLPSILFLFSTIQMKSKKGSSQNV